MAFSFGPYFLYFGNTDVLQEEYGFFVSFAEWSQFIYLFEYIIISFMVIYFGIDFYGFDKIFFANTLVAVVMHVFYELV